MKKTNKRSVSSTVWATAAIVAGVSMFGALGARAEDKAYELTIKDHVFAPETLEVEAGQKIRLLITNDDATPEQFASDSLKREKVIPGKSRGVVFVGPLDAGSYEFHGEFHDKTAKGVIVAK